MTASATTVSGRESLYKQIGGRPSVIAAVEHFYQRVLADDELASYFEGVDVARLKGHQARFIAQALGGPKGYRGRDMRAAHAHLKVTAPHFQRVVEHLRATLTSLDVPNGAIGEILSAVAPLQDQIVTSAAPSDAPPPESNFDMSMSSLHPSSMPANATTAAASAELEGAAKLLEVAEALTDASSMEDVMGCCVETACSSLDWAAAVFYGLDGEVLSAKADSGTLGRELSRATESGRVLPGSGLVGRAAQTHAPLTASDPAELGGSRGAVAHRSGFVSCAAFSVTAKDEIVGVV